MYNTTQDLIHSFNDTLQTQIEENTFPLLLKHNELSEVDIEVFNLLKISYEQKDVTAIPGYETITFHFNINGDKVIFDYLFVTDENYQGDYMEGFYVSEKYRFDAGYEYIESCISTHDITLIEKAASIILNSLMEPFLEEHLESLQKLKEHYELELEQDIVSKNEHSFSQLISVHGFSEQFVTLKFESGAELQVTHNSLKKFLK